MAAPKVETPDPLINPTQPQRDLGNFTLKYLTDLFNSLQIAPDSGVSSVVFGRTVIITTGTAVKLPDMVCQNGIVIKAFRSNAASIGLGGQAVTSTMTSAGNSFELAAGESISLALSNPGALWINGTAGDYVTWIGN